MKTSVPYTLGFLLWWRFILCSSDGLLVAF